MRFFFVMPDDPTQVDFEPALRLDSFLVIPKIVILLIVCAALSCSTWAQVAIETNRGDNTRSGANTNETLLTPGNVNSGSFGHLFSAPVDYQVLAQPLYVPQVNIPGQGTHNVVYVVTQNDSVYAIDADNGTQLWYASMTNGGLAASGSNLPCGTLGGFNEEGIVGTPVIDPATNTMYLVAKSVINGNVTHYLHALDITTGNEQTSMGSPALITASSVSKKGHVTTFNSLHQKNRPGLLLLNGILYLGFGSNGCNDSNSGWVLAYNASNLQRTGVFNTSPDHGLTSIWQAGNGLAADEAGNIFFTTAEAGTYDVPSGGQGYSNSILKLTPPPWLPQNTPDQPADFFTPWEVAYLDTNDLDVSSGGPVILPDQSPGPANCSQSPCHEVVASGKEAVVYVLDRDNMGQFVPGGPTDSQILQEYPLISNGDLDETPAYWNGLLYFAPPASPLQALQVSNGLLTPYAQTSQKLAAGTHAPAISANGNTNGVLWLISGNSLQAYDAISLRQLYTTAQIPARDKLPPLAHFASQTIANGKVYVATQNSLEAYALFRTLSISGGNNQSAPVASSLPLPLQILASDPYTGQVQAGVTITFSDGGMGGTFNPSSAVTNSSGIGTTSYTLPQKSGIYTLTASATSYGSVAATETANPLTATSIISVLGARQTGAAGSTLPNPIVMKAQDTYGNPVPGVTINFTAAKGTVNPTSAVTGSNGRASTTLQLPTTVATVTVTGTSGSLKGSCPEYSVAGPPATITVTGGNNQAAPPGTALPQALSVLVADQYGNPDSATSVTFSDGGAGGTFANPNPENTLPTGVATQIYTLPSSLGLVTITATVAGVANPAIFTEISAGPGVNVASSLNPSTYGQPVTFTTTINYVSGQVKSSKNALPMDVTGTVTWSGNTGCGTTSVVSTPGTAFGMATCTTSILAVGTADVVTATYSGDANNNSGSGSMNQQVNVANAGVSVASGGSPSTYGQSVTFTATITSATGLVKGRKGESKKPMDVTGSLTWSDNTGCGVSTVSSPPGSGLGTATCTTSSLGAGTDTVTATYGGDSNHNGGSGSVSQVVNQASQTIAFTVNAPASAEYGSSFTVAAAASSGLAVAFTSAGACTNVGATYTMTASSGTCSVIADQAGNANYAAAPEIKQTTAATVANAGVSVASNLNPSVYGQSAMFTATITSDTGLVKGRKGATKKPMDVTGGVTWSANTGCGTTAVLSTPGTGTGTATCTTSSLGGGTVTVTATYSGDANHNGGSGSVSQVVNQASQTITFTVNAPASAANGTNFTVAATASSGLAVSFTSAGACTNSGATYTMTSGTGSCSVIANQAGNANYSSAPPVTETVTATAGQKVPVITWPTPAPVSYGTKLSKTQLNATATYNNVNVPGKFVYAPAAGKILPAGNQTLSVTFTPTDTTTYATVTAAVVLVVNPINSAAAITGTVPAAPVHGKGVVIDFALTAAYPNPSGSVTVTASTGETCTGTAGATGKGTCKIVFATAGTRTLTAAYAGNSNYNPSTSAPFSLTVN